MAIRVLLDHGVREDRIIFVTILATPRGVYVLNRLFPEVKIVTGSADPNLTPIWVPGGGGEEGRNILCIEPGMGHIGATTLSSTSVQCISSHASKVIVTISDVRCRGVEDDTFVICRLMYIISPTIF